MEKTLDQYSYQNMFINCVSVTFEEPESQQADMIAVETVETDGFDWNKNMLDAYN